MNDKLRSGMAQATRLTSTGRLMEATALIQRTLQGMLAPQATPNAANAASSDPAFRVIDAEPSREAPAEGPARRTRTPGGIRLPAAAAVSPADHGRAATARTATRPNPDGHRPGAESATRRHTPEDERVESAPVSLRRPEHRRAAPRSWPSGRSAAAAGRRPEQARSAIWAGGQLIEDAYTNPAGTRTYKLYIPSDYRGQALPLVIMLHGCTQTPDDFAAGTRMNILAEQERFLVAYPAQATPANPSKCWNWFKADDQQRDQGEPSLIAGITRRIAGGYSVDSRRVYVAGLSAGGAMAMVLGVSYPDLYAAIGVHSGLAYGVAHDLPSALAAMRHGGSRGAGICPRLVPTIVFHGDRDTTVHPCNGDQVLEQWAAAHAGAVSGAGKKLRVTVSRGRQPEGHAYTRSLYHDANGQAVLERWLVHDAEHAWSGGSPYGSFTDPKGPDASQAMVRFFARHSRSGL